MRLIPDTVGNVFATGDVMQVLRFAILFSCALSLPGDHGKPVANYIDSLSHVIFKIMGLSIKLAPLGVLGLVMRLAGFSLVELLRLSARANRDRLRHILVVRRPAADHGQAAPHGHP